MFSYKEVYIEEAERVIEELFGDAKKLGGDDYHVIDKLATEAATKKLTDLIDTYHESRDSDWGEPKA